jgi:3-dehydroquinate synthetase
MLIEKAITKTGLPTKIKDIKVEDIIKVILSDKKNISGEILFSLPEKIGKVIPNVKISQKIVKKLLQVLMSS